MIDSSSKFFSPDVSLASRVTGFFLFFIYVLQYPLSFLVIDDPFIPANYFDFLKSILFISFSTFIFFIVFIFSKSKTETTIVYKTAKNIPIDVNYSRLFIYITILAVFFLWSYLMLSLKIGITIFYDNEPLPYKIVGILFYGRLLLQPIILSYIAHQLSDKPLIIRNSFFILYFLLLCYCSLVSGSRFIALVFSFPIFIIYLGNNRLRIALTLFSMVTGIIIASISRLTFLLLYLNDDLLNAVYQDDELIINLEYLLSIIYNYLIIRPMGLAENIQVLSYPAFQTFSQSFNSLLSYFLPFIFDPDSIDFKDILGYGEDTYGGIGLDIFSNYWIYFGQNIITYIIGLSFVAYLLRLCFQSISLFLIKFNLSDVSIVSYIILFLLVFDARANLLLYLYIILMFFKFLFISNHSQIKYESSQSNFSS